MYSIEIWRFGFIYMKHLKNLNSSVSVVQATGTTLGIVPLQEKYGALEVQNLCFVWGQYGNNHKIPFVLDHFYTFAGRLHLTLGYTWPLVADSFADELARTDMRCLEVLAGEDSDTMTVGTFLETLC